MGGDSVNVLNAGLPNITGKLNAIKSFEDSPYSGLFECLSNLGGVQTGGYQAGKVSFDASRSNSIYGASTTVQPPAFSLMPQIKF